MVNGIRATRKRSREQIDDDEAEHADDENSQQPQLVRKRLRLVPATATQVDDDEAELADDENSQQPALVRKRFRLGPASEHPAMHQETSQRSIGARSPTPSPSRKRDRDDGDDEGSESEVERYISAPRRTKVSRSGPDDHGDRSPSTGRSFDDGATRHHPSAHSSGFLDTDCLPPVGDTTTANEIEDEAVGDSALVVVPPRNPFQRHPLFPSGYSPGDGLFGPKTPVANPRQAPTKPAFQPPPHVSNAPQVDAAPTIALQIDRAPPRPLVRASERLRTGRDGNAYVFKYDEGPEFEARLEHDKKFAAEWREVMENRRTSGLA